MLILYAKVKHKGVQVATVDVCELLFTSQKNKEKCAEIEIC